MKTTKTISLICLLFVLIISLNCTNSVQPLAIDTSNNIWLVSISPEQNTKLTLKDTLRVKIGYCFDPAKVTTKDTAFTFYMIFKKNNATSDDPMRDYIFANGCSKSTSRWSDTLLLECPMSEIIKSNPQIKPLTFSFQMITGSNCPNGESGICMTMQYAQEYYLYNEGVVVP